MKNGLRWVTEADITFVSENVREADAIEWFLMESGPSVCLQSILQRAVEKSSVAMAGYQNDVTVALLGVTPISKDGKTARIWAIATKSIETPSVYICWYKITLQLIAVLGCRFDRLENMVHAENTKAIRFLKHVGFIFANDSMSVKGEVFYPFHMSFYHKAVEGRY